MGEMVTCTTCGTEHDRLASFPGNVCLDCYAKTPEANAPLTAEGLANMWRGGDLLA